MQNFYEEFGLDPSQSAEELSGFLRKERKKWALRLNAPDLTKRQEAERKLALLDEASSAFESESSKRDYDGFLFGSNTVEETQDHEPISCGRQMEIDYRNREFDKVIVAATQLIKEGDNQLFCYEALADSYYNVSNHAQAVDIAVEGLNLHPNSSYLLSTIIRIYVHDLKNFDKAEEYLAKATDQFPDNPTLLLLEFEWRLYRFGMTRETISCADRYLATDATSERMKAKVADVFLTYSDTFLIFDSQNRGYVTSQPDYKQFYKARIQAEKYSSTEHTRNLAAHVKTLKKRAYNKGALPYAGGAAILGFITVSMDSLLALLGPLFLCFAMLVACVGWEPGWARDERTIGGKDNTLKRSIAIIVRVVTFIGTRSKRLANEAQSRAKEKMGK